MSNRVYLFIVGLCILTALYMELDIMIYVLVAILFLEGVTGVTILWLSKKVREVQLESGLLQYSSETKFDFDAFRLFRIIIAVVVLASYVAVHEYSIDMLWFFPWFFGFSVMGAGVSGVCPVYMAIRWLGFK